MIDFINPKHVEKKWGYELILHNRADYCAKILHFNTKGSKFSLHFHKEKAETWYVAKGAFKLIYINTDTAERHEKMLTVGMTVDVDKCSPHQLIAWETDSEVFEASTMHYDYDSYRIEKGDSQK
jgi:mannose-6-phosphate isomerase-like protein (cupin superfamily)